MLTSTSKTRFGVMRSCQEQNHEGDLGGSPGFGWTGRPKADNILLVRWGVTPDARFHIVDVESLLVDEEVWSRQAKLMIRKGNNY